MPTSARNKDLLVIRRGDPCGRPREGQSPSPTHHKIRFRRGRRLPTVVPTDSRSLSCPPIGALPRNRLASSATGSASPISPTARTGLIPHSLQCVIARALCARGNPYPRPLRNVYRWPCVGADAHIGPPDLHRTSCKSNVIAKPVRTLAVAIRPQSLPCLKGGGPAAGWWRDSCGEESPSHGFAVLRQGGHQPLRRFASVLIPHFPTRLLEKYFLSVIVHPKPNRL